MTVRTDDPVLHLTGPVLVGREDVREEAWVASGRVTFDRPSVQAEDVGGWVLPGLADLHCHVGLVATGPTDDATIEQQALTDRDAGALLLRDAGVPTDTRWVDDREDLPRIIRAGRHIARTHRYIRNFGEEIEPDQLTGEVRRQAGRGDGWVKLVGDWIDRDEGDLAPCWPADTLRDAIAAAHEAGARVTAHCFSAVSLPDLVAAGIDCIEHGSGLDDETVPLLAEAGIPIVPTLVNLHTFPGIADAAEAKFPTYAAHMRALHARRYETVRTAFEAGIPVYAGTDAGGSIEHGLVAQEVAELRDAGLAPLDALDAAVWRARAFLGRPGLEEGAPADLVVYPADPREEVGVLAHPSLVVLRGRVVSGPRR